MKYQSWKISQYSPENVQLLEKAGLSPLVAAVFASRGVDIDAARDLLAKPDSYSFHDPMLLMDMPAAVKRIKQAAANNEHIAIFGDYDVDGITSTCLLQRYFTALGLNCDFYIPDRLGEGYGLNESAILSLHEMGVTLIITVDCGITAVSETEFASSLGIDMIITDHHECQGAIPRAIAAIDPKRPGCMYPNKCLAGVGVAFKLICALEGEGSEMRLISEYGELVALGTVADVMPVVGENRALIKLGIPHIGLGRFPGLCCLIAEAGLSDKNITCTNVGYSLAPRINAAGRMGRARFAAELLLTLDSTLAQEMAHELCSLNRERQQLEAETFTDALEQLSLMETPDSPIVLASDNWHQGIAGIVASRLAERFCLPVVIICFDGDIGRGSCRSFGGFSIFSALENAADLLDDFGGHELAAGLVVHREKLDALRLRLREYYLSNPSPSTPTLSVDVEINSPELLSLEAVQSLVCLEPFGRGNEQPVFCICSARLRSVIPIGGGKHVKLSVSCMGQNFECVFFSKSVAELGFHQGDTVDLAFWPQINEFRGNRNVQLLLCSVRPGSAADPYSRLVYKFELGEELTDEEARLICPERQDFIALWRCILPACKKRPLVSDKSSLVASLSAACGISQAKCRVCLSVFCELGLLDISGFGEEISVSLPESQTKADLSASEILKSLRR